VDDCEELWGAKVMGFAVLGGGEWLQWEAGSARIAIALGVGDNASRHWIAESCADWGAEILTVMHPRAAVSRAARVGRGSVVMANATVNVDAVLGDGVIVNSGALVEHDVEVGEYAHVAPNAAMGGGSSLGGFSHLGIGASVLPCVHIGARSVVGAGAAAETAGVGGGAAQKCGDFAGKTGGLSGATSDGAAGRDWACVLQVLRFCAARGLEGWL